MKTFTLFCLLLIGFSGSAQTYEIAAQDCGATMNLFNEVFFCNGYGFVEEYEFEFTDQATNAVTTNVRPNNQNTLGLAGLTTLGATYDVRVRVKIAGVFTAYGNICTISAPGTLPATQLGGCVTNNPPALALFNQGFTCASVFQASAYEFEFTNQTTSAVTTYTSSNNSASLALAGLYSPNDIYDVRVRAQVNGTFGPFGGICQIKAPAALPFSALAPAYCGATLPGFTSSIQAIQLPGATEYEFEFADQNSAAVYTSQSPTKTTNMPAAGIPMATGAFDVRVRVRLGNTVPAVWTSFGATCALFTPQIVPLTQLNVASCGLQTSEYSDLITADVVAGATAYRFIFEDVTGGLPLDSITSATNSTSLLDLLGNDTVPNNHYRVRVKAEVGGVYGTYGPRCNVFSKQTIPVPKLFGSSCGAVLTSFVQSFHSLVVPGATEYEFRFVDVTIPASPGTPILITDNNQTGKLFDYGLLTPNAVYDVDIRAKVGGVFGAYGDVCQLTAPGLPTTGINSCGTTLALFNSPFTTASVPGATEYEFRFNDGTTTTTHVTNFHTTTLQAAGLLEVGATYTVDVRAKVNGVFGNYGTPCALNAPTSVATTSLIASDCGITVNGYTEWFLAASIAGATEYEFEYTNTSTLATSTATRNFHNNSFTYAGITDQNTTFDIRVRAKIGTTWGAFGPTCQVTTPNVPASFVLNENGGATATQSGITTINGGGNILTDVELSVYPNPTTNMVNIQTNLNNYNVAIYSSTGQLVYNNIAMNSIHRVILDDYAEGLYLINVTDNNGNILKTEKLLVNK